MCAELFKSEAGIDVAIIPYKGTAPVMNDLLGGHVPVAFGVLPPALGNIQAGNLRAIAVTSKKRFSLLPDVPTFDEVRACPDFEAVLHYGLLAPAGTPKEIVERLSAELRKLADDPEVQKRIHVEGGDPLTSTPAEYAADIDKEEKKWGGLVHKLGLKVEMGLPRSRPFCYESNPRADRRGCYVVVSPLHSELPRCLLWPARRRPYQ